MAGGSPGGREVDRLAIRVLPDTSGFATALQRYLDRIEARAQLKIRLTPDTTGFAQAIRTEIARTRPEAQVRAVLDTSRLAAQARTAVARIRPDLPVQAKIDTTGFPEEVRAQLERVRADLTVKLKLDAAGVDGQINRALSRSVRTRDVTLKPQIDRLAFRTAEEQLRILTDPWKVRIEPYVATGAAAEVRAELDDWLADGIDVDVRPVVDPDTLLRLEGRLDRLAQNRTARIDVRTDDEQLRRANSAASRLGATLGAGLGRVLTLRSALVSLGVSSLPQIASLTVGLAQIAPAALVAVPAVMALGQAFATIGVGVTGIGDAFKAAFAPAKSGGGGAAVDTAKQVAAAQRAVADAKDALARTTEDSAARIVRADRDVSDAERALSDAQGKALRAQQALDDARRQAALDAEDLADRVTSGRLAERDAVLRVADATDALAAAQANPGAVRNLEKAQLAYDEAVQALREQRKENGRLAVEQAKAAQVGVEGSARVVAAQENLASATRDVSDAERDVADARQEAAKTARDAAKQVADAQRAVTDATVALADAGRQAGAGAGGVDAYAEAMAKLSPNARSFVRAVQELAPAWREVQQAVQDRLFAGLDTELTATSSAVLPIFRRELVATAGTLNGMAVGVAEAARDLAANGILGRAMAGASQGLANLRGLPGQVVTALTTIGAAAAPALDRVTSALADAATRWSDRLQKGFASGGLEKAIDTALDLAGQLAGVLGNVSKTLVNIFAPAVATGGNFIGVLQQVTGEIARVTATAEVQQGLRDLFDTFALIGRTAAPLLGQALREVFPVLSALAPGAEALVTALGDGLRPVITALGPLLVAAGQAVSQLAIAASPLLVVAGQLAAQIGPILTPIVQALALNIGQLAPVVQAVAVGVSQLLSPALAQLPGLMQPFLAASTQLAATLLPQLADLITQLPLQELGQSFAEISIALAPLLVQLSQLIVSGLQAMAPLLPPLITLTARLAQILAGELARQIQQIVVPALQVVVRLLNGDLTGAVQAAGDLFSGLASTVYRAFVELPGQVFSALGDFGRQLWNSGRAITQSLIDGILSKAVDLKNSMSGMLSDVRRLLPFSPAKEGPFSGKGWTLHSGQSISAALAEGVLDGHDQVYAATAAVAATAQANLSGLGAGTVATSRAQAGTNPASAASGGGLALNIGEFHAYDQAPDAIGRALYREYKSRG
ncbi:phage tail protein [Kitasatospora cheerisanensis]|uniref:Uncharacterized protein n=1 Tax=Kitasatospora cheerisanensis KCTC 2395 TaxID=1348663 RepID=A0A066YS37_9ACTN|nr:hypothetical protein [Kitasatospora cheerisanensis]KDN84373.1 hypothetical protein KCH_41640 [Kitasatospora cheerisanensis KCTC 2395]